MDEEDGEFNFLDDEREEMEEEISYSESDSSVQSNQSKPAKPAKPVKPAKQAKPAKQSMPSDDTAVINLSSASRKRRIFTADVLDASTSPNTDSAVCALCHRPGTALEGGFIIHPFLEKNRRILVHAVCAMNSPNVARSATAFYNVVKTVNRGTKARCSKCGKYGATLTCCAAGCYQYDLLQCMSCSHYHVPCAAEDNLLPLEAVHAPFVAPPAAFLCHDHIALQSNPLLKAVVGPSPPSHPQPFATTQFSRDWLRRADAPSAPPQLGDWVVYFPQGHIQHLLQYGDPDIPFCMFSCCVGRVMTSTVDFPHHLAPSSSIVLKLTIEIVGIPSPDAQLQNSFIQSFVALPSSMKLPPLEVCLRDSDLPDYICPYDRYTRLMTKHWQEGDHFEMEFLNEYAFASSFTVGHTPWRCSVAPLSACGTTPTGTARPSRRRTSAGTATTACRPSACSRRARRWRHPAWETRWWRWWRH